MVTYHNLTQCTEGRLVYIRSTDIEQGNWRRLLWSVPDEWLYFIHKGESIEVVDKTSNQNGGKVARIFCPVITDVLNFLYFQAPPQARNFIWHYDKAMEDLTKDKMLLQKFKFWRDRTEQHVLIMGRNIIVEKEPNPL